MSDTEDEPFDKEAEKKKLRQQLAEEEADRQSTQHMSDLLLKGATMTNRHCDECGDPLFRHEGREFCPTCGRQRTAEGVPDAEADFAEEMDPAQPAGDGGAAARPDSADQSGTPSPASDQPGVTGQPPPTDQVQSQTQHASEADLPAAREALARKVTALAREAEATTDVGRARDLLAAVREGAEALRALERSGR